MKKPPSKTGKPTAERKQGKPPGDTGGNKPVVKAKVPQVKAKTTFGKPSQTQKL